MGTHCLQEEIIIDILCRLPLKPLVRFKCVSKFWNKLISEPYFKRKHLNHAKNQNNISHKMLISQTIHKKHTFNFYTSSLSLCRIVKDVLKLDIPSNWMPGFCKIYCSYDGLFLIRIHNKPKDSIFLLWNPSTRESILLPHHDSSVNSIYGLGYDSNDDAYKVLKVEDNSCDQVPDQILSLKSGSWRKTYGSSNMNYDSISSENDMDSLAFVHGAFHWIHFTGRVGSWFSVISFNISNEIYGEVPLPEQIWRPHMMDKHIIVLGGMLSINCVYGYDDPFIDVWVMKDYGGKESWTKLFSMTMRSTNILSVIPIIPKYIFAGGEMLFSCGRRGEFMTSKGSIRLNNLMQSLGSDDIDKDAFGIGGYIYIESLISPEVDH